MRDEVSSKPSSSNSTTTSNWSKLKDPRIVRVSRALGGKDRHSKVCTVKGLRDRRVRLSVPTAIQLYDLQDRLGLNQPSKVVDWLLNVAKHEIDELPPLQIPQGFSFSPNLDSDKETLNNLLGKNKDVVRDHGHHEKYWARNEEAHQNGHDHEEISYVSTTSHPSSIMNSNNNTMYNSFVRWDVPSSNLTLGSHGSTTAQVEDFRNFSLVELPGASSHHQVLVYQPEIGQSYFHYSSQVSVDNSQFEHKLQPDFRGNSQLSISSRNSQDKHNDQFHL